MTFKGQVGKSMLCLVSVSVLTAGAELFLRANRSSASQEIPRILLSPGSLPYSERLATCPYPEPARSTQCFPIPLLEGFLLHLSLYQCNTSCKKCNRDLIHIQKQQYFLRKGKNTNLSLFARDSNYYEQIEKVLFTDKTLF
jgi:hypothetical protein